ncbi:hypothetical protein B0H17DRAFT_1137254 [Mycena rosella]|uniref:Uncharacterized protein n=1 Tax=Mycena rosella TaxID=1033263 RepID=A0AAD7GB02_MYCRO|nr:hypothetical protein B0H17DRAFT_1137254 [Mycena rosella]
MQSTSCQGTCLSGALAFAPSITWAAPQILIGINNLVVPQMFGTTSHYRQTSSSAKLARDFNYFLFSGIPLLQHHAVRCAGNLLVMKTDITGRTYFDCAQNEAAILFSPGKPATLAFLAGSRESHALYTSHSVLERRCSVAGAVLLGMFGVYLQGMELGKLGGWNCSSNLRNCRFRLHRRLVRTTPGGRSK